MYSIRESVLLFRSNAVVFFIDSNVIVVKEFSILSDSFGVA